MAMDMMAMVFKSMGIDASAVLGTAQQLGAAFTQMLATLHRVEEKVDRLQASVDAISADLGIFVPPPSGDQVALITAETAKYLEQFGGHS